MLIILTDIHLPCVPLHPPQLTISNLLADWPASTSIEVLRSLGSLSQLQHLNLSLDIRAPQQLQALPELTNLRSCSIGKMGEEQLVLWLEDVSMLFTLTQLTSLAIWNLQHPPAAPGSADTERRAWAPLAGLSSLQSLAFSPEFHVDDPVFSAMRQLTKLTSLSIARIDVSDTIHGQFPDLVTLNADAWEQQPSILLRTLSPLLPLSSLVAPQIVLSAASQTEPMEAAALKEVASILASAPRLLPHTVTMTGRQLVPPLNDTACTEALALLAGTLRSLHLDVMPALDATWAELGSCLKGVRYLQLSMCSIIETGFITVLASWSSLVHVEIECMLGSEVSGEGWVALAALRSEPLRVTVDVKLSGPVVLEVETVQLRVFGKVFLSFN